MTIAHPHPPISGNQPSDPPLYLPDHKQFPESDGTFVKNFQEHPQSLLLTSSRQPILTNSTLTANMPSARTVVSTGDSLTLQNVEQALQASQRAEQEHQWAEQEKRRADRLAAQLRSLGLEPEA